MKKLKFGFLIVMITLIATFAYGATNTMIKLAHFSDYHSHAQSFYSGGEHGIGGIARLMGYLKELNTDKDTLVFCGGDMVNKGTPAWSDKYRYMECYWLNNLVDAMAYGNHEGDYGRNVFNAVLKDLTYPVLCSNLEDEHGQSIFNYGQKTYITFDTNGVKLGVFALAGSDYDSLVKLEDRPIEGAVFTDRKKIAKKVISEMKTDGCDLIVLIGHATTEEDIQLAKAVDGIDIIFGTHSHLRQPLTKIDDTQTYMISPYQYGVYVSNVIVRFDKKGEKSFEGSLIKMDKTIPEDPYFVEKVATLQKELEADEQYAYLFEELGTVSGEISTDGLEHGESEIGNLVTDLMRKAGHSHVALSTASSFRTSIAPGILNFEALKNAIPYKNFLYVYDMAGSQLMDLITLSFSKAGTHNFSQISGAKILFNDDGVISCQILKNSENPSEGYEKVHAQKIYKVATTNYQGLYATDYKDIFADCTMTTTEIDIQELTSDFFRQNNNIRGYLDGRIEYVPEAKKEVELKEKDTYKIGIFSDPHYFSKTLHPEGEAFENYLAKDRKLLHLSADITEETVNQLIASDCDLIIVPGDLTKDGEKSCHEEFATHLKRLSDSGKPIFVINGNHDINNPAAVEFKDENTQAIKSITPSEFREIYADYGYNKAIESDIHSLSYVVEPASWLRIIAMDSCFYTSNYSRDHPYTGGFFTDDTYQWIKEKIKEGKKKGQIVIGFMHHGIIPHLGVQEQFFAEYLVDEWEKVATDFAENGMQLVFTGHFHAQDISEYVTANGKHIWDVQTGSLVTYPIPYREVIISKDGKAEIDSKLITQLKNVDNFGKYSKEFLYNGMITLIPYMLKTQIVNYGIPQIMADAYVTSLLNQKAGPYTLTDLAAKVVTDYYAGDENPSDEIKAAIEELKESKNKILVMIGGLLESYTLDTPPQDNAITLYLSK